MARPADVSSSLDRPELKALPATRFVYCEWETVRANIDDHVQLADHYYSVPYSLGRVELEARLLGRHDRAVNEALVRAILASRPHPEQGYRSCLGLLRLSKRYDKQRLEAACTRAHAVGALSYRHVAAILKNNLDRLADEPLSADGCIGDHDNIRGAAYYDGDSHAQ